MNELVDLDWGVIDAGRKQLDDTAPRNPFFRA